jgi:hypothetical protein
VAATLFTSSIASGSMLEGCWAAVSGQLWEPGLKGEDEAAMRDRSGQVVA